MAGATILNDKIGQLILGFRCPGNGACRQHQGGSQYTHLPANAQCGPFHQRSPEGSQPCCNPNNFMTLILIKFVAGIQ
jgi:hypothetical protein